MYWTLNSLQVLIRIFWIAGWWLKSVRGIRWCTCKKEKMLSKKAVKQKDFCCQERKKNAPRERVVRGIGARHQMVHYLGYKGLLQSKN